MKTYINNIAIFTEGSEFNPPLIFIHGFPFDHNMWKYQIDKFKDKFYCVAYDITGLGESSPKDGHYTIDSLADDLFDIIAEMKLMNPIVCALSMGGYIAFRAAEKNQDKFKALIICSSKPENDTDAARLNRADGIKKINTGGVPVFTANFLLNCFAPESIEKLGDEFIQIQASSSLSSPVGLKAALLAMAARTDVSGFLQNINIPTLLLCGEKDTLTPPEIMKAAAGRIPGAEFKIIPDAGHMIPVENPEAVNNEISAFLTKIFAPNL